ncbi:MAG TPA: dihydrodipicolinate synthase family protein [Candidatus Methylacidiphilales bacterium]|nr:dihydrodipicolinate synthase family protein [Candidatus Methylacidiphilales bacterium]
MAKHFRFLGLVAAPFTPFRANGSLNLEIIPTYARFLQRNGVTAAFVCGTTGEGASMTVAERKLVAEAWLNGAPNDFPIIVHAGHSCLEDARELAAHAEKIGAAAVAALSPYFFKPRNNGELLAFNIALAAAAPSLPYYFYNIPAMTGMSLPMKEFCVAAATSIPNFAGVKYTYEDLPDYEACIRLEGGRFDMLFGRDEILASAWARGARGFVGSTYNFAAPLYMQIIEALKAGENEKAERLQATAVEMIQAGLSIGASGLAAFKAIMPMVGVDCGPVRLPLTQPPAEMLERLRAILKEIGFFSYASKA